jgi:LemA protein
MRAWMVALLSAAVLGLSGCGYNKLQQQDESVKAAWSEVVNQYQRRADLVPNLVNTVKGFAAQEQKVLIGVTEARAQANSVQVTPEVLNNPDQFQKYQAAQGQLTQALSRLMVVVERYPELKSDQNFLDLQSQLEGTENRITVARNRYIEAVQSYNVTVRSFPVNLTAKMFDFQVKPNFTVANEQQISTAPTVSFDTTTPPVPGTAAPPAPAPAKQ